MGFFGTYLFERGRWSEGENVREAAEPWLFLNIYDSDIATIMYQPSRPATGMAFLGVTPRSFFDDATASPPTDVVLEASGLAAWWRLANPGVSDAECAAKEIELRQFLAPDTDPYALGGEEKAEFDDGDLFVEIKAGRFLAALGLPLPEDLLGHG